MSYEIKVEINFSIHRDGAEFECIYAAYCYEVNEQAKLGGMASSVAKINSVGLRLALKVFNLFLIFSLS